MNSNPDVPPLQRRAAAAEATFAAFRGKPMRYGSHDCVRLMAHHLRLLGHSVRLPPTGAYRSARSALKALNDRGFANLAEAMDSMGFERIAPAAALIGDALLVPAEGPFGGGLHIAYGNGRSISYHQDAVGVDLLQPVKFVAAWRLDPK